jgi:hypothetical protein
MGRSCNTHVRMRNAYKVLDRKPERMRALGRHLWRWIFLRYSFGGFGLVFVSECKVTMVMYEHSNEPLGTIKSRYFLYIVRDH